MFDYVGWLDNWNYNVKGLYTMYMKIHLIFNSYTINFFRTISQSDQIIVGCSHVLYKESKNSYL